MLFRHGCEITLIWLGPARAGAVIGETATSSASLPAGLSQGFDPECWDRDWKEWDCAWRQIARIDRKPPSSWKLADMVIRAGLRGILFPSLRHAGGTNLVIFPANLVDGDSVTVHDPDHRMPQDQSSWP